MRYVGKGQASSERRDSPRYTIAAHGRAWPIHDEARTVWGRTSDMSRFGLAFVVGRKFAHVISPGEAVYFELEMPGESTETVKVVMSGAGTCVRCKEWGSECTLVLRIQVARLERQPLYWEALKN